MESSNSKQRLDSSAVPERYRRQVSLPEIGSIGQERLADSAVLVAGCGALGGFAIELLARAGVGELVIVDRDIVDATNLQRQVLYDESDAKDALPKVEAARNHVARINSNVVVHAIAADIGADNIETIALTTATRPVRAIIDALDNFEARMVLNDVAIKHGIPLVYAGAVSTFGSVYVVLPPGDDFPWSGIGSRCLRCLFSALPPPGLSPSCDTAGVLGPLVAVIGAMQAAEAMKILVQDWVALDRSLRMVDCWHGFFQSVPVDVTRKSCPCCYGRSFDYLNAQSRSQTVWLCGADAIQVVPPSRDRTLDLKRLAEQLPPDVATRVSDFVLRCDWNIGSKLADITLFKDGRAIVRGVESLQDARHVYQQLLGI